MSGPRARARRGAPAVVLLVLLWLVALNLRSVSIGVAPVLPLIRTELGISFAEAGILFALPVVFMGLFAAPGGRLADRLGTWHAISISFVLLITGGALRALAPGYLLLLWWTAVFSAGIGLAQPSLARLVRDEFPTHRATATGVYSTGFITGAILAASTTGQVLAWSGPLSWRGTCLAWAALAGLSLLAWLALGPRRGAAGGPAGAARPAGRATPDGNRYTVWRDRTAWLISAFFLAQGLVFYTLNGWLPSYYQELGLPLERAGEPLALFSLAMLPVALSVSWLSDRVGQRRPFLILASVIFLVGQVGMLVVPFDPFWLWMILMGIATATVFAIALVLPIDLPDGRRAAATVSLMLTVGYVGILVGPLTLGALRDLTGSFGLAWLPNVATCLGMLALAVLLPETGRGPRGQAGR